MILSLCLPVIFVLVFVKDLYNPVLMFYLSYSFSSSSRTCMILSLCLPVIFILVLVKDLYDPALCLPVIFILVLVKDLYDPVLMYTCHIHSRPRQGPV